MQKLATLGRVQLLLKSNDMKYVTIFLLLVCFKISGHDHVPADTYKQLFSQLEVAYEDLINRLQTKDAIIKAKDIEIIQLRQQIKESGKQNRIEEQ